MKKLTAIPFFLLFLTFLLPLRSTESFGSENPRTTQDFNQDWSFAQVVKGGERSFSVTNFESPDRLKPGDALTAETLGEAQTVRLPHDWGIAGPFDTDPKTWGGQGKLPWRGIGWYSKTFTLTKEEAAQKRTVFDFGGCMAFPEVYVNGKFVGGWDYGYQSFQVDATDFVQEGENRIQVRCDTRRHGSRWYPGAGIYRPVQMILCDRNAWLPEGAVFVTTPEITPQKASVRLQVQPQISQESALTDGQLCVRAVLRNPEGKIIAETTASGSAPTFPAILSLEVPAPTLWDVDSPRLYSAEISLCQRTVPSPNTPENQPSSETSEKILDFVSIPFGIRTIEWAADDGFHLNGRRVQLYGVDLHHDQGILGAAAHPAAIERQLKIMKEMGANAIRTSHNPASREFMNLCDQLGFIVWDELFDKWNETADLLNQSDFDAFTARQVQRLVERDRNHPSVCVWSIGNEIWDVEGNTKGSSNPNLDAERRVKHVADCFRAMDPSRLAGMGCFVSGTCGPESHVRDSLDVTGWNYGAKYREARVRYPKMPLLYTESASALSTRGYYQLPHPTCKESYDQETLQVDGYDLVSASGPRDIPDIDFARMETDRYVAGEFVWTGFDYLGEPTPFDRQARSSYFGIVDLCGLPKDRFFLYRSYWAPEKTTVHILPHWNWADRQSIVPVYVYSNGDSAELFLNGKSLGRRSKLKNLPKNAAVNSIWDANVKFSASSEETKDGRSNLASRAFDAQPNSRWCAEDEKAGHWLQIDFGKPTIMKAQTLTLERGPENYRFHVETSQDGSQWQTIFRHEPNAECGSSVQIPFNENAQAVRFMRVVFDEILANSWASVREWTFTNQKPSPLELPPYYSVIDRYRLRWENVRWEPGTLEAVAFRDGKEIGRSVIRTAGEPTAIRLTPESNAFRSDDDLCFVLAEAVDANGNVCPWDERKITAQVTGPAELVGIDAGNPMCFETIPDAEHSLFFGKAVLVLRSRPGNGSVNLRVTADGVKPGMAEILRLE